MALTKAEKAAAKAALEATGGGGDKGADGPEVQTQAVQRAETKKTSAGAKVTVACNLPHGLRLRTFAMRQHSEQVMGGGSREVKLAEPTGHEVLIMGTATEIGKLSRAPIVAGYAMTSGVDKDVWDAWLKDNANSAMVKNKCVMAFEQPDKAAGWAKEHEKVLTGLQPLELENDPRRPRPSTNLVGGVTTATNDGPQA